MNLISILLLSIALLFGLFSFVSEYLFRAVCMRKPDRSISEENYFKHLRDTDLEPVIGLIKAGKRWLRTQLPQDFFITSFDKFKLHARFFPAEGGPSNITIVCGHGWCSNYVFDFGYMAKFYHDLGYNLLLIDQRAHENSAGKIMTMGIKERVDMIDWANFISSRLGPNHKIILHGVSMGATAAMMASGSEMLPKSVIGIIADSGYVNANQHFCNMFKNNFKLPKFPFVYTLNLSCQLRGGFSPYLPSAETMLAKAKVPVMFIHSEHDQFVPVEQTYKNYQACISPKSILITENTGHAYSAYLHTEEYQEAVSAFLDSLDDKPIAALAESTED